MPVAVLTITNGVPNAAQTLTGQAALAIVTGAFPAGAGFDLEVSDDGTNWAALGREGFMGLFGSRGGAAGVSIPTGTQARLVNATPGITTGFTVRVALQ